MIAVQNSIPSIEEFRKLMKRTDNLLNREAIGREEYYSKRNGTLLEEDVYDALSRCAVGTPFENSIDLVSGKSFPDIIAHQFYGVEVKSTNKDQWTSTGGSILESTRNQNVERIFLTFGKLGKPVTFMSRPYEKCLSGISVTHYPRYHIDMRLHNGETIFDKMGISYDQLRKMENPVAPVAQYYRSQLKPGQSLWWAPQENIEETSTPAVLRLWSSLSADEKMSYTAQGYDIFPEIFGNNGRTKYQRYTLWLASRHSVICCNVRDYFSAGGRSTIVTAKTEYQQAPAVFRHILRNRQLTKETILNASEAVLCDSWQVEQIAEDRIGQWCELAASYAKKHMGDQPVSKMLREILGMD